MSRRESVQKRLQKVRPPRVQLTYDVEKGDAIEQKELPFVVGVIADLSGMPEHPLPKLKDRKFVQVDMDNFDDVMRGVSPRVVCRVPNRLGDQGGELGIDLCFSSIGDFRPEAVVGQVEPLRRLLEARTKLADLRNKLAGNEKLEDLLSEVLANTEDLEVLAKSTSDREAKKP